MLDIDYTAIFQTLKDIALGVAVSFFIATVIFVVINLSSAEQWDCLL